MTISHQPLENSNIGTEIGGLDPNSITDDDKAELHRLFLKYGVLVLRGLTIDNPTHVELTTAFGKPELHAVENIRLEGCPEIILLDSGGDTDTTAELYDDDIVGNIFWHADLSYTATLSRGAVLLPKLLPAEGGDTAWIDTVAVYEGLPADLKKEIEHLEAIHQFDHPEIIKKTRLREAQNPDLPSMPRFPDIAHPLVVTHPESGYKALNISPMFTCDIVGYSKERAGKLLERLKEIAVQSNFTYVHHWREGDIVVWDNWRTCHTALGHKRKYRRKMHRTTLTATVTFGREYESSVEA
tara:strand:+ start:24944 stop:25837 length:894 start_codon:yes stop_codon:yes gene_type:complete